MYKKRLLIPVASVSFVLLLTLGLLLNPGTDGTASGETSSSSELRGLESLNAAFVKVAKDVPPSVVNVNTTSIVKRPRVERRLQPFFRDFFGEDPFRDFFWSPQSQRRTSLGSGVIVNEDGYILTNNHVVIGEGGADVEEIKVILSDKREFDAKLIGRDPDTDVAVIKIDAKNLPAAKLGDSDKLQVGEWVLAIGRPLGLSQTVTHGIVSATGRSGVLDPRTVSYQDFIQTDAAINRGNSGGPLVNIKGEVIGINTAIATEGLPGNIGIGFSIPINMARDVMDQLIEKGRVVRGWLGIQLQEVDSDIAERYSLEEPNGVLIASIIDDPAKEAGLESGDLIIEFDGETVRDSSHLKRLVATAGPDKTVKVKVIRRSGKEKEFKVKLAERTADVVTKLERGRAPSEEKEWMGITVQELTDELAQRLGYEEQSGVLISDVDPEGPAAKAKNPPRRFDLIQEIERQEIENMEDYRQAIKKVEGQKSVLIRLQRAGRGPWYAVLKKE